MERYHQVIDVNILCKYEAKHSTQQNKEKITFMIAGAVAMYLSPLWYVIDSCPMISAPPYGSGTLKINRTDFKHMLFAAITLYNRPNLPKN